ncbi:hypothetical protein I3842_07G192100 [Carya illinoinensis]|uniref:Protein kinase domain-containing protein n=1 Tax=Carya illinoinensis TaxID=32201 RepID=A0A922JIM4_CARIL|nr:hypothetical protein I3842_07G192100 [Carya illinoinensis]KAG6705685.1 hypothetical protein I3842_07G192100 [Carya illinoinensis]
MESPCSTPTSFLGLTPCSNDESPRVKFLCSFSGSILPRPQDGKLRYVGGETRIVSVLRAISYEELMSKMRELYEGATVLKYQQPDEDLDALVSVVNDDDVTNMMEEYDKLGSGDGFTRLRIFLFSHTDQDGSHYVEGNERETERRYVDALNSLNDASDFRKQQQPESPRISLVEDIHVAEQFFNPISVEGGLHSQRTSETPLPQFNLRHLTIPHVGSAPHQPQRYNEMEAPWSPAYYSPRHYGPHDPRQLVDYPSSPSSARYRMPFTELTEKCFDRMPDEFSRQQVNHQPRHEHQPQYSENVVWVPTGAISGEKSVFPGNVFHTPSILEGNSVCEHCRMTFHRNQPHLEHPHMGNGFSHFSNSCADCPQNRETLILNADANSHHGIYPNEPNSNHRSIHNETRNHERGWILQQQLNAQVDEARMHVSGAGRLGDHFVVDGPGMSFPLGHGNIEDSQSVSTNYAHHLGGPDLGNEVLHDQAMASLPHIRVPPPEECGVQYGNLPCAYGGDNLYPMSHGNVPGHALWRNNPVHVTASYEASGSAQQVNGTVNPGSTRREGSPRFCVGVESQISRVESSQKVMGLDGKAVPEYSYGHALKLNPNTFNQESHHSSRPLPDMVNFAIPLEPVPPLDSSSTLVHDKLVSLVTPGYNSDSRNVKCIPEVVRSEVKSILGEEKDASQVEKVENSDFRTIYCPEPKKIADTNCEETNSICLKSAEVSSAIVKPGEKDLYAAEGPKVSADHLSLLPELIASVKRAALGGAEEVKARVKECTNLKEATGNGIEATNAHGDLELDYDNDNLNTNKIEPTKAEAEAIDRGLQTIKNDDLEEIRELGSGTYGSVYHGKWKGSDVAIKRIKASCFAGRPSERERLIADFWKEALILSSLHHPNVVSFYGIVRDGPDGSLATVTEFMINGSLKQFLQKKDRTIDRRKRLIIAMDAAFGMEYLHGKNIVHFDLKCENLLVNMRDPQRPVCKIGDLGLSKVKQHTLVSGGVRGTLPWMAPELLSGKSHMVTEKIDVYSFGIVMWELLTGDEPYADMHCASIIGGIVNNTLRPQIPTWCDPEWKSLMESCWASDPSIRPSFSEISQKLRNMAAAMNVR